MVVNPQPLLRAAMALLLAGGTARAQLRTALEVRSLPPETAETGLPADLRGVVVFSDPPSTIFFQDGTAGTFFRLDGRTPPAPGDEVRVVGKTMPGLYLPGIHEATFEILGHPGLPEAIPASLDDLLSGRYHYQRVSVEGIVRTIESNEENTSRLRLDLGSRVIAVQVETVADGGKDLVDARIRVTGLAAGEMNHRRQLVEPYLRCHDWGDLSLITAARPVAEIPAVSPGEILTFAVGGSMRNRTRLSGVVLAAFGEGEVFLRSEEAGIAVRILETEPRPDIGDEVEIVGFPEMDRFSARLVDASVVSRRPGGGPPDALSVSVGDLLEGLHDNDLVSVEADLVERYRNERGSTLLLREGGETLRVEAADLAGEPAPGTRLRATGIAMVESSRRSGEYRAEPDRVVLRLRGTDDLAVLSAPSWWTSARLAAGLVVFLVATVLAGLWIVLLRRQVTRQTAALRHRIEHEAILEERQRLAREFHDTLEQQLAGLSLRLDAAVARGGDEKLRGFLQGSRSLVSRIQTETRNLVSDLRQDPEEAADLVGSLGELLEPGRDGVGPEIAMISPASGVPALPSRTVHHLRMIAQESLTNAIKHSGAKHVDLILESVPDGLVLRIRDDGRGFDAGAETSGKSGHFGCMGMRERCRKIGARIDWRSAPGEGTEVTVTLPNPPTREVAS
jgi:signal transduction histidine kinase